MRSQHPWRKHKSKAGFSLLEVMIAMMIMSIALTSIYMSTSDGIYRTIRTKELNIATWLAHNKMVESEHLFEGKAFSELSKDPETDKFKAPFEQYVWKREVREMKFPDLPVGSNKEGEGVQESVRILAQKITKFLNSSLRELVVTVSWDRGKGEQHVTLTTYLVDMHAEFDFSL